MRSVNDNVPGLMIGTFEGFELTHNRFGQQYTMIDGTKYVTFFDLAAPELANRPGWVGEILAGRHS